MKIKKDKFCRRKSSISLEDVGIEKVSICNKVSSGDKYYKYFIGYLYWLLPKTSAYVKSYDGQTKCLYFVIRDSDL